MSGKNVFAYTAPGSHYPEYLSVNDRSPFELEFTLRGPPQGDKCGETVALSLKAEEVRELINRLQSWLTVTNMLP